jgi:glutamate 5-kinase
MNTPSRIVVKVGTSTLTSPDGGVDRPFLADLVTQLAKERQQGRDILLVTSGAIKVGRDALAKRPNSQNANNSSPSPDTLPYKQAAAAIGQGLLMHTYTEAFAWRDVHCAQVLLTRDDLSDRKRFLNARNTLLSLLALGVVPVINENDTVAVDEIKFGDNDMLAALVATLVEADLLLILSDVEGLYASPPDPHSDQTPPVLRTVERVDNAILALAGGSRSGVGTGGMRTKVEAARIATESGIRSVIAPGRSEGVLAKAIAEAEVGTTFLPQPNKERLPARKRWIAHSARPRGSVTVNVRAKERLRASGVSLLAVGITEVCGNFHAGDLIEIRDEAETVFGRGLANYSSSEIRQVQGLHSDQFESILGYRGFEEILHRDNLVIDNE